MTAGLVAIPALTFRTPNGRIDIDTTAKYAERAASTWIDTFILSGTTTEGDTFTVAERGAVLDIWREIAAPARLLACCWESNDIDEATARGIRPMAVMRQLRDADEACRFFASLPSEAYVYSHPIHTPTLLDAQLIGRARPLGCLPAGAKISKLPSGELGAIRAIAGEDFTIWDGSCRHMRDSYDAGANGVVATPLAALPNPFPRRRHDDLRPVIDGWQADLDGVPDQQERADWLRTAFTNHWRYPSTNDI